MTKLSLCAITGNVGGEMMRRFLDNFGALADEIVIVRAIGNQQPDDSLDAAIEWGARTSEYFNRVAEWPHVDDFSAARNLSWSLATGDWIMWADTDDIISRASAKAFRACIEQHGEKFDMLQTPYMVPDAGYAHNMRERVVRRGIARWVSPVHECLEPIEPGMKWRTSTCHEAQIVHSPPTDTPRARGGRNLRILETIPEEQRTLSHKYHLFSEHCLNGNLAAGALAGEAFLRLPDGGRNERFEIAVWLSMLATEPNTKRDFAQLALGECPERREPYVILADLMLNAGHLDDAQAYHRAAAAQPPPAKAAWNHRRSMWGWTFVNQAARIARARGRWAHADAIEFNHFRRHDGKISLLHATRGRAQRAVEIREMWLARADNPDAIEHIFACDADDEEGPSLGGFRHIVGEPKGPCSAWNLAAAISHGEILVQVSDDMYPPPGWDRQVLAAIGDTAKPAVLRVSDGHRTDGLIVLAIVTRAWYRAHGLFHPGFFSMYSDNWLTECAAKAGAIIEARHIVFEHRHSAFTGEPCHATTARSNDPRHYADGQALLEKLRAT